MEKIRLLVVFCCLIACWADAGFAKRAMDFELRTDHLSKYIWRGQNVVDDPVFQPSISASSKGLTATVWGNLELTTINENNGEFSEVDYTVDYSGKLPGLEKLAYSVGVIFYDFPVSETRDTSEIYWRLGAYLPFSPSVTVYHDLDEADGTYLSLDAGHRIDRITELAPNIPVAMEISASLGWGSRSYNKYYWGTDQAKLNDMMFSVSVPIEISGCILVPRLNYVTLVGDDIRDTDVYGTDSDFFFAGVSISKNF